MLIYKQQNDAKSYWSKELKSKVHELNNLLSELNDQGGYFIDFMSTKGIQAGIIRLHPGENDTQEPHSVDEVYYVIEGSGFIKLDGKDHQIRQGTSILFLPKLTTGFMEISKTL
jgi:mannose-6-phosphate isomerase-like protein (cupin superfamily)